MGGGGGGRGVLFYFSFNVNYNILDYLIAFMFQLYYCSKQCFKKLIKMLHFASGHSVSENVLT